MNSQTMRLGGDRRRVCAYAPNYEFVGVRRPLENVGVVPVKAAFQFNYNCSAAWHRNRVVMAVFTARNVPFADKVSVLHEVEDGLNEFAFVAHRRRKLAAYSLDGSPKNTAVVKFQLIEPVASKLMRLRFQSLGVLTKS